MVERSESTTPLLETGSLLVVPVEAVAEEATVVVAAEEAETEEGAAEGAEAHPVLLTKPRAVLLLVLERR